MKRPTRRLCVPALALAAALAAASPADPAASDGARPAPSAADADVPAYPTRVPPTLRDTYTLKRGMLSGTGDFVWRVDGGRYEAKLEGSVAGVDVLSWVSRGTVGPAGLEPDRFSLWRIGRGEQTMHFDRAAGTIVYTGSRARHPLLPGTQDRLSWMIQLPAIVAARPEAFAAGARIVLRVTGTRGNPQAWALRVVGRERVRGPGGPVDALKVERVPRHAGDAPVEVWLDPKRHYLPLRARLAGDDREPDFELVRERR